MKIIGIDLTPIQGPHRMRGVGSVVINFVRNISEEERKASHFVFYLYGNEVDESLKLAGVDKKFNYSIRIIPTNTPIPPSIKTIRGLFHLPLRLLRSAALYSQGNNRLGKVDDLDVLIQFEQDVVPPPAHLVPTLVVAYDLIPYILKDEYLWDYKIARQNHRYSRRGALLAHARRYRYLFNIKQTMKIAHKVVAISEHTKKDFLKLAGIPASKIDVVYLGVSKVKGIEVGNKAPTSIQRYISSSWGDIKIASPLPKKPYLLFVGGADPRRKIHDLVSAYNLLKAQGNDIHLVFAGDTMLGPNSIPNPEALEAISSSSYKDDMFFLGFVSEEERDWLYRNALAFVYPSSYEGFGLPILEAMQYGTPVITYNNSSIKEIGGDVALYAKGYTGISNLSMKLLQEPKLRKELSLKSSQHAGQFTWEELAKNLISIAKGMTS